MSTLPTVGPVPAARRHTLHFLAGTRSSHPVHLDAEVDATALLEHRAARGTLGGSVPMVTYVVAAVARVMAGHPEANAAHAGLVRPRRVSYDFVDVKLTVDQEVRGTRSVLTTVLQDADRASLGFLGHRIARLRELDPEVAREFAGARLLRRLPMPVGRVAFALATRARARHRFLGTVAVTSLGHRRVKRFFSDGGTALTFGVGHVEQQAVARDGDVRVAPVLPLCLTFDHRVVDGAAAADVLDEVVGVLTGVGRGGDDDLV